MNGASGWNGPWGSSQLGERLAGGFVNSADRERIRFKLHCISLNTQYKDVDTRTVEILQRTRTFNIDCCVKVHNAHFRLALQISGQVLPSSFLPYLLVQDLWVRTQHLATTQRLIASRGLMRNIHKVIAILPQQPSPTTAPPTRTTRYKCYYHRVIAILPHHPQQHYLQVQLGTSVTTTGW